MLVISLKALSGTAWGLTRNKIGACELIMKYEHLPDKLLKSYVKKQELLKNIADPCIIFQSRFSCKIRMLQMHLLFLAAFEKSFMYYADKKNAIGIRKKQTIHMKIFNSSLLEFTKKRRRLQQENCISHSIKFCYNRYYIDKISLSHKYQKLASFPNRKSYSQLTGFN